MGYEEEGQWEWDEEEEFCGDLDGSQLIFPQVVHREVLQEHCAGLSFSHLGEEETFKRPMECLYWPIQWKDAQNWC